MGNHMSACTCITSSPKTNKPLIIFPNGKAQSLQDFVKVAEIMLECPNFFVVNSKSLIVNKRFCPLSADEDLEIGNVYVMFPMRRVNSMVTVGDLAVGLLVGKNGMKRISGRVSPVSETVAVESEVEQPRLVVDVPEFGHRLLVSRSKKPVLDTISEEPGLGRSKMLSLVKV